MPSSRSVAAKLVCHPAVPRSEFIRGFDVSVSVLPNDELIMRYELAAEMTRLRIPTPAAPRCVDGLWKHTCFEVFLGTIGNPGYLEFNFSPSGEWGLYQFKAYRDGGPFEDGSLAPSISTEQSAGQLTLTALIRLDRLPPLQSAQRLRVGLSAVIEGADGLLSYWALNHPSDKPDFHHAGSFAVELALPGESA